MDGLERRWTRSAPLLAYVLTGTALTANSSIRSVSFLCETSGFSRRALRSEVTAVFSARAEGDWPSLELPKSSRPSFRSWSEVELLASSSSRLSSASLVRDPRCLQDSIRLNIKQSRCLEDHLTGCVCFGRIRTLLK